MIGFTLDVQNQMNKIDLYPLEIVFGLPPVLTSADRCSTDLEIFGMSKSRLHRPVLPDGSPNGTYACNTFCFDGRTVYFVTDPKDLPQALDNIKDAVWVFANMKFDITHMRRWANIPVRTKKMWDVISIDQIMYAGYYNDFTLADLVRRRLNVYLPKEERGGFEKATELNDELIKYSAYDALATWHVYKSQRAEISPTDLKLWAETDLPGTWVLLSMTGIKPDTEAWLRIAKKNRDVERRILDKYPDINLRSSQQVGKKLVEEGYKRLAKTEKGNIKADRKTLEHLKDPTEFVKDKLEFASVKALLDTFGEKFLDRVVEPDGRVYADFHLLGAATGRMSCSKPNLQNIPRGEHRECFVADEGNVLIIGDWSTQEPRIYAYLTQDQKMIDIFNAGKDIYIEAARLMYGWELTKKDPRRKNPMKPTVLGACYGLTEHGMEREYGIPKDEGRAHLDAFFGVFTQAKKWNDEQRKRTDYVETILGRKFWLNTYDWKSLNNALNSPVQGSASDAMKQAAWCFCEEWGATEKSPIVNLVHDEIVLEVHESAREMAMECLRECMVKTEEKMHPGIKASADVACGHTWASKA